MTSRFSATLLVLCAAAAPAGAAILKGPYLQDLTQTSVRVRWETDSGTDSRVDYGTTDSYGSSVTGTAATVTHSGTTRYVHSLQITPLSADTTYHYKTTTGAFSSADHTVRAALTAATPFRFAAYGDNRSNAPEHQLLTEAILASSPSPRIVLNVGDLCYDGDTYSYWASEFFTPAAALLYEVPLYVAIGNHDKSTWVNDYLYFPNAPNRWYSFDIGNAHFAVLDTEASYTVGSAQYTWLDADLSATAQDWVFVMFHYPAYSSGMHGGYAAVQANLVPLLESHGVDMVFNGDDHLYERSLKAGVNYVVTGGGGAPLYAINQNPNPYQVYAETTYEFCTVDLSDTTLLLQGRYGTGVVFDFLSLGAGDADGDGYSDAAEIRCEGDPADAAVHPAAVKVNFQPSNKTRPDGFAADSCATFGASGTNGISGYGWVAP
ncbi:MAG: metallophosphoesterase family protein [Chlamydiota bacterium]